MKVFVLLYTENNANPFIVGVFLHWKKCILFNNHFIIHHFLMKRMVENLLLQLRILIMNMILCQNYKRFEYSLCESNDDVKIVYYDCFGMILSKYMCKGYRNKLFIYERSW